MQCQELRVVEGDDGIALAHASGCLSVLNGLDLTFPCLPPITRGISSLGHTASESLSWLKAVFSFIVIEPKNLNYVNALRN